MRFLIMSLFLLGPSFASAVWCSESAEAVALAERIKFLKGALPPESLRLNSEQRRAVDEFKVEIHFLELQLKETLNSEHSETK